MFLLRCAAAAVSSSYLVTEGSALRRTSHGERWVGVRSHGGGKLTWSAGV